MESESEVTRCLERIGNGDRRAIDELLPCVYEDLRAMAGRAFRSQRGDHTLQPTALVNEAYLRLVGSAGRLEGRRHFLGVAALAMRQLLNDYARRRSAEKRGGRRNRVLLTDPPTDDSAEEAIDLEALDGALTELLRRDPRQARIVELRFLAGLEYEDIAELVGVSERTVRLDWQMARAWLRREIERRSGV